MAKKGGHLPPSGPLDVTLSDWGKDLVLFRVHPDKYKAAQFNPSDSGDARFSPSVRKDGSVIPTLYAGTTLDCALMETVFHDVPYAPGLKTLSKKTHVEERVYSSIQLPRDLKLIDLGTIALRKLGIPRSGLIDTDASEYSRTRQWALALYENTPAAEGLLWTSRQDDRAQAIVLFGERLSSLTFGTVTSAQPLLLPDGSACKEVLDLAVRLGVLVI